jgi:hypothetical protein
MKDYFQVISQALADFEHESFVSLYASVTKIMLAFRTKEACLKRAWRQQLGALASAGQHFDKS